MVYVIVATASISSVGNKSKQSKAIGFCILMTSRLLSLSRNLRSLIICRRSRLFAGTALASPLFPPPLVFAPLVPCESHPQTSKPFATARSAKKSVTWKSRAKYKLFGLRFRACIFSARATR